MDDTTKCGIPYSALYRKSGVISDTAEELGYSWDQKEGGVAVFESDNKHYLLHSVPETLSHGHFDLTLIWMSTEFDCQLIKQDLLPEILERFAHFCVSVVCSTRRM